MKWFRKLPIARKLAVVIVLTVSLALLFASAAFIRYDVVTFRNAIVGDMTVLADVLAANSAAGLNFDDAANTAETLSALNAQPHVMAACVYDKNGRLFAKYIRAGESPLVVVSATAPPDGARFEAGRLELVRPILSANRRIGTICLRSDLGRLNNRLRSFLGIAALVLLAGLLGTLVLSNRIQRLVSSPILSLADIVRKITAEKNYAVRAVRQTEDEIGQLTDGFNQMLAGIEQRDASLLAEMAERKRLEAKFIESHKMEAIGQLAGGMAHDYNNILAASSLQLSLLMMEPGLKPELQEALTFLMQCNDRAAELTHQVLTFSRRQPLQKKRLQLNLLVADEIKILRRLLPERIELVTHISAGDTWVEADSGMIHQMVINLCINARDAMPKGGKITLGIQPTELSATSAQNNLEARPGKFICLSVADQGCGMNAETLARIFEPFFTTKDVGKGTGLGLAVVYGIVKQHDGWIEVKSEPGQGTEFRIFLPASLAADSRASMGAKIRVQSGGETILVVEDEEFVIKTVVKCLQFAGYRVWEARNAAEALDRWAGQIADIDLLLTDMIMPGEMNGLELANRFRKLKPNLPVVITSGYSEEMAHAGIPTEKGIAYLPKPATADVLTATIRKGLDEAAGGGAFAAG